MELETHPEAVSPTTTPTTSSSLDHEPLIHEIFESSTSTWQWIVADPTTREAVIIDPVLDAVPKHLGNGISTTSADRLLALISHYAYRVVRILETHTQRPHATSAWYLRTQLRDALGNMPRICTGKSIAGVQRMFARQYRIANPGWGKHFDSGFTNGQRFGIGTLHCQVLQLTGNGSCFGFVIGRNVFMGEVPTQEVMRGLAGYTIGYAWHPGGGGGAGLEFGASSRPNTMATNASFSSSRPSLSNVATPYSPLSGNSAKERTTGSGLRPASHIHEMP